MVSLKVKEKSDNIDGKDGVMFKKSLVAFCVSVLLVMSVLVTAIGTGISAKDESLSEGRVAEENAVEIEDWHDLDAVRDDLDGDYVLINDLDEDTDGYDELVDTEEGWEPIGDSDNEFTGTFDGDDHEISDLYIDRLDTWYVGLFGYVNDGREIRNLGVVDADVSGESRVGGLVGQNRGGTVSNSYATGDVSGEHYVGGLVGLNRHTVENSYAMGDVSGEYFVGGFLGSNSGTVSNSYATGDVSGVSEYVGGLVGQNINGTVENSYSTGDVSGESCVGGLVGLNWCTVSNSYATGEVKGEEVVGGLVGQNRGGEVKNSYALGDVSGDQEYVGGLVGHKWEGTVENSFWDVETSGQNESDGGTGKTTEEMTGGDVPDNMDGFDFNETWETVEEDHEDAEEDGYPILQELNREYQLKAQDVYVEDEEGIPGFISITLVLGVVFAVAIYSKKSNRK